MTETRVRESLRIGWLAVGALAIIGYMQLIAPSEREVRATLDRAHSLYELTDRNRRLLGEKDAIDAARTRVQRDVTLLAAQSSGAKVTLSALRLLQREAREHHAEIRGLTPEATAPAHAGIEDVGITLRGTYRDLVALLVDLSRREVILEVSGIELSASSAPGRGLPIDAVLHVRLYHGISALEEKEESDAPTAVR